MEVLERALLAWHPAYDGRQRGLCLGLVLGAAFVPWPVAGLGHRRLKHGPGNVAHVIWRSLRGLSIPLPPWPWRSGVPKARQRPLRIAAGVAMIALVAGIATDRAGRPATYDPDYTASLQADAGEACETGVATPRPRSRPAAISPVRPRHRQTVVLCLRLEWMNSSASPPAR